jgi:flagellar FliL protein
VKVWIAMMLALILPWSVQAEDKAAAEGAPPTVSYVTLRPPLVGNYLAAGRLKLYKADIALRVAAADAKRVEHHEPLIRNQLVALFSEQTDVTLSGAEAREKLRAEALKQVQDVLSAEEGQPLVEDLLFNNLIIQ